jgi:hypothetical protein
VGCIPASQHSAIGRNTQTMSRGDVLTEADLALLAAEPDDTLPLEAADKLVEVIDALEDRLETMMARLQ